jgi:hypothetical protein
MVNFYGKDKIEACFNFIMADIKYNGREITPEKMRCGIAACPAIYEVREVTPQEVSCGIGACPAIFVTQSGEYAIIGKTVSPKDCSVDGRTLEGKVGEGEALIVIPRQLIDGIK